MMNDERNAANLSAMTVKKLRQELLSQGLKTSGVKSVLIDRLRPTLVEVQKITEPINTRRRRHDFETDSELSVQTVPDVPRPANLRDTDNLFK